LEGCRSAGIGCLECKQPVIDAVLAEQAPIRERAVEFVENPNLVRNIITEGCEEAREVAGETLNEVKQAMGLSD
jgi:tryptophanyl-tRNA synthetase